MAEDQTFPKVSAVMPVGYGDRFFRVALQCFLDQDYQGETELIVVDNSEESIKDLLPDDDRITYIRATRKSVGALRNEGNAEATGDILFNWDEDDWYHPGRISLQLSRLAFTKKAVTGFHSIFYYDTSNCGTYRYIYSPGRPNHQPYACGSSQCYLKEFWQRNPYPKEGVEDYQFGDVARMAKQLDSIDGSQWLVARAHHTSACPATQLGRHQQFPAVPASELPAEFFTAIARKSEAPKAKAKPKSKTKVQE